MSGHAALAAALTLVPASASACAVCLTSGVGDRAFNWAFVLLMLMPFAVAAGLVGILARRLRPRHTDEGESASSTEVPSC